MTLIILAIIGAIIIIPIIFLSVLLLKNILHKKEDKKTNN